MLGTLGWAPEAAASAALVDVVRAMEGYQQRERRENERAAWIVSTIMNMSGKMLPERRTVTIEELLKPGASGLTPEAESAFFDLEAQRRLRETQT